MSSGGPWIEHFPGNFVWSNAALVTKGMAPYGTVALGEIDQVCERLRPRQGEPDVAKRDQAQTGGGSENDGAIHFSLPLDHGLPR